MGVVREWCGCGCGCGVGIAAVLLAAGMGALAADGIEYAEIGVDTANPSGAHRLYERLGYVAFDESVAYAIEL